MRPDVAVLFAMPRSIYHTIPGVDVWDEARDARNWPGGCPVVAHPPCRTWGQLRHMATLAAPHEHDLAIWAVEQVRQWGGVLEHPHASRLWPEAGLPEPGLFADRDAWGGWTLEQDQFQWGHLAAKRTRFYIVGCEPHGLPEIPLRLGLPSHGIQGWNYGRGRRTLREVPRRDRSATPPALAAWLVELARSCGVKKP